MVSQEYGKPLYIPGENIYRHIESWWGEQYCENLIQRILDAPEEHQRAFHSSLPSSANEGAVILPDRPAGALRPVFPQRYWTDRLLGRDTALRVLLYAHEIVLDYNDFLEDFYPGDRPHPYKMTTIGPLCSPGAAVRLRYWMKVRPLLEEGLMKLVVFPSALLDEETFDRLCNISAIAPHYERLCREIEADGYRVDIEGFDWRSFPPLKRYVLGDAYGPLIHACRFAQSGKTHMLALNVYDQAVITAFLDRLPLKDDRQIALTSLAAFKVPSMAGDISSLIALRKSDVAFADWRQRLSEALRRIGEIGWDDASLNAAADIVSGELKEALAGLESQSRKSPALHALKAGLHGFAIGGVSGITTEVLTSDFIKGSEVGAAGAAAGMAVEVMSEYVRALEARRHDRLIMDVSLLFDAQTMPT